MQVNVNLVNQKNRGNAITFLLPYCCWISVRMPLGPAFQMLQSLASVHSVSGLRISQAAAELGDHPPKPQVMSLT